MSLHKTFLRRVSSSGHPHESFEDFWMTMGLDRRRLHRPSDPPALPYDPAWDEDITSARQVGKKLQHLRLPVDFGQDVATSMYLSVENHIRESFACQILEFAAPTLIRLSLHASDLLTFSGGAVTCVKSGKPYLDVMLFPFTLLSLQHLDLRGWLIADCPFQEFLSRHTSTLKELSLTQCAISDNPSKLGWWAGNRMFLSGAIIDVRAESNSSGANEEWLDWDVADLEDLWLAGRPNCLRMRN